VNALNENESYYKLIRRSKGCGCKRAQVDDCTLQEFGYLMTFCALLLSMAGAALVYLASTQQKLLRVPLHAGSRIAALAAIAGGAAACFAVAGIGAGIATTLITWMLTWVALPYLSWWRGAPQRTRAGTR
jgi:hypothetical protein